MTIQAAALFAPLPRRAILTALAVLAGFDPESLLAQNYPSAPIKIVVPYPPPEVRWTLLHAYLLTNFAPPLGKLA